MKLWPVLIVFIPGLIFLLFQIWGVTRLSTHSNRLFFSTTAMIILALVTLAGVYLRWPRDTMTTVAIFAFCSVGFWGWCLARLERKNRLNEG